MFGLEFLMAGMLAMPHETSQKAHDYLNPMLVPVVTQIECRAQTPPKINVLPSKSHVRYDFSKSKAQLNSVDVDTISPYGPNHKTTVSGLMSGSIQVSNEVAFMHETYDQLDQGCLYIKNVDVKVHIDPTVYVANEYPKGTCMHNAVLTHERKHVREDQLIVNKYSALLGKALVSVINSQGASLGPYEISRLPFVQQNVQKSVTTVVKKYNDQMNEERRQRQQAIDNLEEYETIGKGCKDR